MSLLLDSSENIQNQPEARSYARPLPEGGNPFTTPAPAAESRNVPTPAPAPADETAQFAPSVRAALEVARSDNLDAARVARGLNIARNLGLPQSVVMADLDYARQEEVARKIEANPLLAGWAAKNEFNAAVVSGDVDRMKELCTALQKQHETWEATRPDMGIGERVLTLLGEGTRNVGLDLDSFLSASARWFSHGTLRDADGNELGDYEHAGMREWADRRDQEIARIKQAAGPELQAQTTLGGYLQDVVRQIPQLAAQIGATLAGGPAAGMALMGGQIAGDQYSKLMEHGVDPDRALAAGVANAVMQAPLEQLGLGRLAGIFKTSGLKNIAKRTAEGVLTEGGTEFLQAFPESATELWAKLAQDEGASDWYARFVEALPETARQGLYEAAVAAPFGVLGGMGKAAYDRAQQKRAEAFSAAQIALHEKVEATQAKKLEPEIIESVLAAGGMDQVVGVDAEALRTLHQEGRDFLTPLGLDLEDVETAAAAGQDVHLPLVRLHSRLNQEEITAIMPHVRQTPEAMNGAEAARVNEKIAADALKVAELFQGDTRLFEEMKEERQRLHAEAVEAIRRQPGLLAQAEASSGSVDAYVNDWLNMVQGFAYRMGASGQNPVELMRRITLDSLRAKRRAHMSQEEVIGEDLAELAAKETAEAGSAPAPAGGLRHLNAVTMDDVYALAEQTQDQFYADVESWAGELGGAALFRTDRETGQRTLKNRARAERKLPEYDGDAARVVDILGGTILFDTRDQVEAAAEQIRRRIQASGGTVVRDKNRFANPAGGYKDYQFNYRYPNGFAVELQLNTKAMSEAKEKIGHKLYELQDLVKNIIDDPSCTEEEKAVATILRAKASKASKTLYGSTGDQSNETASFSSIIEPYVSMEAWTSELAGTSVYGKLSELFDFMRNSLKSLVRTYGNPSQSINSLTNTGEPSGRDSTRITGSEDVNLSNSLRTSMTEPPLGEGSIAQNGGQNNRPGKIIGSETTILGKGTSEQARYEVWELDDVIPSHDPENGFARREDYPAAAQERPYHSDAGEQEKVRGNALSYQPAFVVNSDPTAGNGPPIVTREGIVLGGNSRTMTLQLVYADRPDSAAAYRQTLTDQAAGFGLDPAALEGMRRPILVRVVDERMTPEEMAVKSRLYNQTTTQKLQAKAEGVSRARMISPATLAALSADMADFDTLRQFLDSPRSKGFVGLLLQDGVIEQTEISSLTEKGGRLNDSGKKLVEDALRGMVVADYDVLEALPASVLNKLDRTIPALARLKARGEGWDMGHVLTAALRIVGKAAAEGRKVEGWLGQVDLLDTDPDKKRPAVQALALTFANATQKEAAARFEVMAGEAERQTKGQGALIARPENRPGPAFVKAFLQPLASVDGRTITGFDPRGDERHAALQWAYEHGGKGKTVSAALDRLQKIIGAKKSTPEQKAEAREMIRLLSEFSGAISMYPPKLGPYFRYQEGQELFQAAFHGTPHRFDRFSLDAIGTGEGNQSHGWGLYFAKDKNVSEDYRKALANSKEKYVLGGKAYTVDESNLYDIWRDDSGNEISGYEPVSYALRTYSDNNKDIAAAIEEIKEAIEILKKDASASTSTEVEEKALKLLEGGIQKKEPGQLFEVDIPENDMLLDEQKTLGEQPEKVQSALRALAQEHGLTLESQYPSSEATESGKTFWIKHPGGWEPAGAPRFRSRAKAEQWLKDNPDEFVIIQDGKRIYNELADRLGSPRAASLALNDLGVKGVTYDGAQDGRCFVVFDDKAINILQTYYQERDDPRGSVQIYPEGYLINLFQGADLSTLLHETGHIFFEEMERMVRAGAADETMRRDYETMRVWLGAEPGQTLTEEMREKAARGFEAYLMEGKAPSVELESAFARFRKWLLAIYRSATRLNAPLTDEVRGVFDRLLSSEREIAATAARNELLDLTARELDALGLTGTARTTAAGLMGKGREAAAQSLQKSRDANRKARMEKYTREARDEVRAMPVYRARGDLRRTPLDLEAVREGFGEDTARSLLKSLPGSARKDGGVDPEIFAAEHGYENAAAMFADVLNAKRQGDAIAEVARQKEARHDAEYDAFEHLMETREVSIQMELVGRKLAELLGAADIEREAYMRAAERELAAMPLGRAVQTGNFLAAMRRALRQSRTALAAGDRKTALDAHRKAMLNMEFVRLSRDLARRRDSAEGQIKRFIGMKKGDPDARYMVMDIGMRHGLVKFSAPLAEGRDVRTVQAWMQGVKEDGYEIFSDDRILYGPGQPWREMSVADFESLVETVAQIVTVERNRRRLLTAKNKADLDEAAEEIAKSILTHRKGKAIKTVEKQPAAIKALSGLHAIHTKIEALCLALDGDAMGAAWEYIYRPITEADDRQSERFREVRDALKGAALFGAYTRKELALMGSRKELVPETGERLTWENRIAVALNMGNETNMGRLRDGHHWTDAQIAAVVRPLTARDWQFVQSVWDYIAGFKDEAFALQEEVTGLRPAAVEAKPLTVQTADGRTLELAGGYYPIKYNADKGFMAFAHEQREMDRELFGGRNYGAAMTRNGHLKERAAGGMGSPLLLELSVITDHLFNVVHDLTYRKAVLDVAKIIRHSTVREAIESTVGAEMYRQLQPWLQDVANERQEPMHAVHRWARWARASTSIMQMGYKATTILAQPLGITQTAELLGYKWTGVGLKHVYRNPMRLPELLEETFSRSPMMANRIRSFDREVRDIAKQLTPGMDRFAWVQTVRDKAFVPMGMVQMGVDLPTWWGAYAKGLQDFAGDEGRAARYADSIVRMSQGSGSTKDLARVQRGGDLLRLTTMFYSYFNTLYNLGARRIAALKQHHAPADIFKAANTALLLWFVPAVFGELLAARGPDDDEEPGEWAAMHILQYPFQAVVGIRDIANYVFGEYGYQITPAQAAPKALGQWFKSVNRALEKGDAGEVAKPTAEALGYLFGLPMKQPIITCGNLWDFVTGEDPDFAVRDLFFVKPK